MQHNGHRNKDSPRKTVCMQINIASRCVYTRPIALPSPGFRDPSDEQAKSDLCRETGGWWAQYRGANT